MFKMQLIEREAFSYIIFFDVYFFVIQYNDNSDTLFVILTGMCDWLFEDTGIKIPDERTKEVQS